MAVRFLVLGGVVSLKVWRRRFSELSVVVCIGIRPRCLSHGSAAPFVSDFCGFVWLEGWAVLRVSELTCVVCCLIQWRWAFQR